MEFTKKEQGVINALSKKINKAALRDIRFVKKIRKLQTADDAESMLEVMDIISAILSPDDEETLYKVFEEEEGMADIERIGVAIAEIMKRSKDAKKSSPSA